MYYEIYVDSLFLVNFVMNLYLLLLVNAYTYRTATRLRLLLGAAIGAVAYLFPFWSNWPAWLELLGGMVAGTGLMLVTTFQIRSIRALLLILEKLLLFSFLMGGCMVFLLNSVPMVMQYATDIFSVMGAGAIIWLSVTWILGRKNQDEGTCKVTLITKSGTVKVTALIDSGNSLVEPISGKPVSVMADNVFRDLWKEAPSMCRVVPYHSIGKRNGILKAYLVPEIRIEDRGVVKVCKDVYVAVSEEHMSGVKIIVNPDLLKNVGKG